MSSKYELNECLELLELSSNASYREAKKAYYSMIQKWHPDRFEQFLPLQNHAVEMTQKLNAAIEVLHELLPEDRSIMDQVYSDSFDSYSSEWSAYYSSNTEVESENEEFESVASPQGTHFFFRYIKRLFNTVTTPFKLLTDLIVFIVVDKPAVPIIAAAIFYGDFVRESSKLIVNF